MKKVQPVKKHLLVKRGKMMKFLQSEGYNGEEIGIIFGLDRSGVSRILKTAEEYKKKAKKMLAD